MSKRLRGITIEIGGDTKNLNDALTGVNQQSKNLQSELRDVERLLKLDPKNVDLLTQRKKLLTEAVQSASDRLDTMREAQQQAAEAFVAGKIGEDQYRAIQREVVEATSKLKTLKGSLDEVNDRWGQAGEKLKGFGDRVSAAGAKLGPLSAAAGAAMAGIVGMTVKSAAAADEINTLSKQTGLSVEEIQKFQYASGRIDVPLETLTGAMARLTRGMGDAHAALTVMPPSAADMEMATLNLSAAQARLTEMQNSGKASSSQLLKAQENVVKAQERLRQVTEGSSKEMSGAALAFSTLGIEVANADGSLRSNQEVMSEVIAALAKKTNATERDALAMEIFGKSAQDLNPLILGGADALTEMGAEAEKLGLVLSQDTLDGLNAVDDELEKTKAQLAATAAVVSAEVGTVVLPMLQRLAEFVQGVAARFREMDEGQAQVILTVLALVAGLAPVIIILGNVASAIGAIIALVPTITAGFATFKAMMLGTATTTGLLTKALTALKALKLILLGPIGLVIAAVAALTAGVYLLIKNWDTVKEFFANLWASVKVTFDVAVQAVLGFVQNLCDGAVSRVSVMVDGIRGIFASLIGIAREIFTTIQSTVVGIVQSIWDGVVSRFQGMVASVGQALSGIYEAIVGPFRRAWDFVSGIVDRIRGALGSIMGNNDAGGGGLVGDGTKVVTQQTTTPATRTRTTTQPATTPVSTSITQNITVVTPKPISPSETARQISNASRALAMELH